MHTLGPLQLILEHAKSKCFGCHTPIQLKPLSPSDQVDGVAFRLHNCETIDLNCLEFAVKGDTLWDIAKKYLGNGSRYPEIKTLNGLKSNVIYSGWKLKIPN